MECCPARAAGWWPSTRRTASCRSHTCRIQSGSRATYSSPQWCHRSRRVSSKSPQNTFGCCSLGRICCCRSAEWCHHYHPQCQQYSFQSLTDSLCHSSRSWFRTSPINTSMLTPSFVVQDWTSRRKAVLTACEQHLPVEHTWLAFAGPHWVGSGMGVGSPTGMVQFPNADWQPVPQ